MRALECRAMFAGFNYDNDKHIQGHRDRLRSVQSIVDSREPECASLRHSSPSKRLMNKQGSFLFFPYDLNL